MCPFEGVFGENGACRENADKFVQSKDEKMLLRVARRTRLL